MISRSFIYFLFLFIVLKMILLEGDKLTLKKLLMTESYSDDDGFLNDSGEEQLLFTFFYKFAFCSKFTYGGIFSYYILSLS